MAVEFHDFSIEVKDLIEDKAVAFLMEAAGAITSATKRNLSGEKGRWHTEQAEQWEYKVDESKMEAVIGNPMERSLWTEFGTGEFADGGKGRKGWWVYVTDENSTAGSGSSYSYGGGKSYTKEEAIKIMAMLRSDGLDAHITHGQRPKRPFQKAYTKMRPKLIKLAEERFREMK